MLRIRPGERRSLREYAILSFSMSLVAGAVNSSGLLAAGAMTSHMTGNVTRIGEGLALGSFDWKVPAALFGFFLAGAFCAAAMMRLVRSWVAEPVPAMLAMEALLLACLALGPGSASGPTLTTRLLCFCMGWQNSLITAISAAVVRTTHVTGATTDLGIELANLMLSRLKRASPEEPAGPLDDLRAKGMDSDVGRATTHLTLLVCFLVGATVGPLLFVRWGYAALMVPAMVLMLVVAGHFLARRLADREALA